ncbi:MAG: membrane protein insertase YidC [Verrucomicrobiales bacterium]|jgi:YidC/Oxa1 family membrane protein insertase|nr:membrane protein insertase YidC [Verrucomicrobiales bacterium]
MDKTAIIVISVCVALFGANLYYANQNQKSQFARQQAQAAQQQASGTAAAPAAAAQPAANSQPLTPAQPANEQLSPAAETLVPESNLAPEQLVTLENNFFRVIATTHGGGIKRVELKKHTLNDDHPVILNNGAQLPVFNIQGWTPNVNLIGYQIANSDANSVTFTRELQPGITLTRKFTVSGDYSLTLEQTVTNGTAEIKVLPPYRLNIGAVTALHPENGSAEDRYVTLSWYTTNGSYDSGHLAQFNDTSFAGMKFWSGKKLIESSQGQAIRWASVKSQFFALIVDCIGFDAQGVEGARQYFPDIRTVANTAVPAGIVGDLAISGITVNPNTSTAQKFTLYAGPKENSRLQALPDNQARVMEFGWFGIISRALLWLMNSIHSFVPNYGVAVIFVTIILRAILWWPQSAANRSMKRMQAVAPLMKEMQEKYKDKPDKLNQEMLKIYKDYGVNPVGGCLPMLIQFPIFIGFYWMLQSSIELRHEHFLWIKDLSQPDTVLRIPFGGNFSFPLNPMPLIMTLTMYISMRITPQPQGVDNPMMKMMRFMPLFFLIFCYNFSSALSLYWTAQNILSIIQMRYNLKQVAPTLEAMKAQAQARKKKQLKR